MSWPSSQGRLGSWSKAGTPANIKGGFVSGGIHPFQPDKWTDDDFCLAQVTDRPNPQGDNDGTVASTSAVVGSIEVIADSPQVADEVPVTHSGDTSTHTFDNLPPSTSPKHSDIPGASGPAVTGNIASELSGITPESVRPFPLQHLERLVLRGKNCHMRYLPVHP